MPQVRRTHVILYVADADRARTFWRRVLEAEPALDVPGMTEFAIGADVVLGLMPEEGIARLLAVQPVRGARVELYLVVDDAGACHQRALAAGARELSPLASRSWGDDVAYSLDPDGTVLAFATPTVPSRAPPG